MAFGRAWGAVSRPPARPVIGGSTYPGRGTARIAPWRRDRPAGRARPRARGDRRRARALRGGPARAVVALEGEPGIGKSRLLAHLAARGRGGCTVLEARASEFEADLPYALWTEALDATCRPASAGCALGSPTRRARRRAAALGAGDGAPTATAPTARCATCSSGSPAARPLVVCLDDVHWADPRRSTRSRRWCAAPPAGAGAARGRGARRASCRRRAGGGAGRGVREDRVTQLALAPLSEAEAARAGRRGGAPRSTPTAGGNPFYLEQLARAARKRARRRRPRVTAPCRRRSPRRWPASWRRSRPLRAGCSTRRPSTGDPFEPGLAGEVAELADDAALRRARRAARPRRCVRAATARRGGSRSATRSSATPSTSPRPAAGASAPTPARARRSARSGAGPVRARAPRRARGAARRRDRDRAARRAPRRELQAPAPATAARFQAAALRLLPDRADCIRGGRGWRHGSPTPRPPRAMPRRRARRCSPRCATARRRRPPRPHRRHWPTRSGGSAGTRAPGAGCRSRSPTCPPGRRRTGSACASRWG